MRKGIASRSLTTQLLENVFLSLLAAGFTFITFYLLVAFVDIRLAGYDHLLLDRTFRYSVLGVCVALAFLFFCVSYTVLIRNTLRYLQTLKASLDTMAGGELEQAVPIQGYDELSELAIGMDEMRRSFLAYIREEDRIRSANSQLVTAMSHDLRTPLTSLMAYLELLDRQKYTGEDQMRHLIKQSLVQAQAIKAMTNKLFEYFLVYASEWEQPGMEDVDADGLICPLWREYVFGLENEGFQVTVREEPLNGTVNVNPPLLRRAFDNVYSNLLKYADPARPIDISWHRRGGELVIIAKNGISPLRDRKESTNIGLNTCRRVLQLHGGHFETAEEGGRFLTYLSLPLE